MDSVKKLWHNFKAQPDVWFLYGFLATFTLSIRKVLFFYPISGQFNEYSGIYLYLGDIFLILTIIFWIISILRNKSSLLSSYKSTISKNKLLFIIPLLLAIWSFISTGWVDNKNIALFRSIKLLEFYLLYAYVVFVVPCGTILKRILQITIFFGLFQSIIGIWQFIVQKSVGLFWLKESLISPEILGVAKIILGGEKFIRSYGLFPHPNILGGFLLFSIIVTFVYHKCSTIEGMFHVEHHTGQAWNNNKFFKLFIAIQFIALLLTFSKSAILGVIIALLYIFVPHGTKILNSIKQMFHPSTNVPHGTCYGAGVEHFRRKILILIGIVLVLAYIIKPDINSLFFKSLDERSLYTNVSYGTILSNLLLGLGSGQFVPNMQNYTVHNLESWQYQPVHNVLLLIWSELGIIGISLFLWWIWRLFHVKQKIPKRDVKCSTWNKEHCEVYEPVDHKIVPHGTLMFNQQLLKILKGLLLGLFS